MSNHVFENVFDIDTDDDILPSLKFERRISPRRLSSLIIRDTDGQPGSHADKAEQG